MTDIELSTAGKIVYASAEDGRIDASRLLSLKNAGKITSEEYTYIKTEFGL